MKGEWTRYVQRPCPESARRKQCEKEKSVQQQQQLQEEERRRECEGEGKEPKPEPKPRPQSKVARWPQTLRLDDYRGPETVSLLRGVRMTMAVLLPGILLGAHLYRRVRRAAEPERRREAEAEPGAARLETEETGLKVQETSAAEAEDGSERTMVWKTVYEHGRDHD